MLVCFPVLNDEGLKSQLAKTFESAKALLLVDSQKLTIHSVLPKTDHYPHPVFFSFSILDEIVFDAIVLDIVNEVDLQKLKRENKRVFKLEHLTIDKTLEVMNVGRLSEFILTNDILRNIVHDHAPHGFFCGRDMAKEEK